MRKDDMMKLKAHKTLALAISLLFAASALAGCGAGKADDAAQKTYQIGVVQLVEHPALDAANKGFVDGIASKGFKDNINFDQQNAQADQSNLQNIGQRFINNKVDLICAIATPAAQSIANMTKDIPIVATAVTDYEEAKLVASKQEPKGNVTGTTDMNPIAEQLDLLLKIVPHAKTIGTVYSSSEVNSQIQVNLLKKLAASKGITVAEATVSTVNDIQQAARSLVGKVDAFYIPTDNVLSSALPTLADIADEAKLPVICGEENQVKSGGLATLGVDYYKLGFQTGEMAADILSGKAKPASMPIQSLKEMKITVNEKVAKKLGITIPQDILDKAEILK